MGSTLPPDPYAALGLSKDATQNAVKTAHRKLVLKCHPDKVADPAAKQAASDQFHRIQTAYEILIDEDRRARYDAEVKLAELRREAFERQGTSGKRASDSRVPPSSYRTSNESVNRGGTYNGRERPVPVYEERRPSYAPDHFDYPPARSTAPRRDPEMERPSRRPSYAPTPREKERVSTRSSKETERDQRKERARRADRETRRSREQKYSAHVEDESSESLSDEYTHRERKMREEDEYRRAYEQGRRSRPDINSAPVDERSRKMKDSIAAAWDYVRSAQGNQRPENQRPSSPVRMNSSKDKAEFLPRGPERRPTLETRRPSERPKTSTRDSEPSDPTPRPERRTSPENAANVRKPPTLNATRSSPADIRATLEKGRSQSLQEEHAPFADIPSVKRADTFNGPSRMENVSPPRNPSTRQTQFPDGFATPGATPEYNGPSGPNSTKYNYSSRPYADDTEYATPDGYRTETMRPRATRKATRSPSPAKDAARESRESIREKGRTTSSRYTSGQERPPNMRTTSYVVSADKGGVEALDRSRQASSGRAADRDPRYPLYGEIPSSASRARHAYAAYEVAPDDSTRSAKPTRPENIKVQSGYGSYNRSSNDRTANLSRNTSGGPIYTTARG